MTIEFQVLSSLQMQLKSYGRVERPIAVHSSDWRSNKGTLVDPRIFGCELDWRCACGRLRGEVHEDDICDMCGVRVGRAEALRCSRFGHIEFRRPISHPLIPLSQITMIPVLPIALRSVGQESDLNELYNRVLLANVPPREAHSIDVKAVCSDLESAVAELFCNESRSEPVTHNGRVLRSIAHYGFSEIEYSMEKIGLYLFALGLHIDIR